MRDLKDWIIGGIIVVAFAAIAIYFYTNQQQLPNAQILSLPISYTGPVNVSNIAVEINYANIKQQCFGQSVQIAQGFSANGLSSQTVLVTLSDSCQGVHKIYGVSTDTSGFSISATNPSLPISLMDQNKLTFNITVKTPASYSGVLDVLVNAS